MRSLRLRTFALLAACVSVTAIAIAPAAARAQDEFEDDFDEEYEERQRERARPEPRPEPRRPSSASEFDDLDDEPPPAAASEDDPFADEEDDDDVVRYDDDRTRASSSDSAAPQGRAPQGRGDVIEERASDEWRERRFVLHNTWGGSVGGIHVLDAGSGPSESFRAQLLTDFFIQNGYLWEGDDHKHIGGSLSLSWSPWDFVEIFASLRSYASSTGDPLADPALFQVLGDSIIGLKGYYEILPIFTLGGDISVAILNSVGGIGVFGNGTSFGLRANASLDLRALPTPVPFIARLNVQYWVDNSAQLITGTEAQRYQGLPIDRAPCYQPDVPCDETRHLLTRFERRALGINRMDFFNLGIGFEAPITVMPNFTVSPLLEWVLGVPVNRASYDCLYNDAGVADGTDDGCIDPQGFLSFPSTLTLGVKVMPPFRGLSITAAVDIGTTGMQTFVRELAPNAPYDVILGIGYAFDAVPVVVEREVERRVEVPTPEVTGRLIGTVVESGVGTAIVGATVAYADRELTAQATGPDGRFVSYELPPGDVIVDISHRDYNGTRCQGTISEEGGDVEVRCELVALPRVGQVMGQIHSEAGAPVSGATINVTGPTPFSATSDGSGSFSHTDLAPGSYTARVDARGFLLTQETFTVVPNEIARPDITVIARPAQALVSVRAREIIIRRQVNFATDSAEILADSSALLTEIADAMLRHPDLRRIEIQGHTDNNGDDSHNQDLSQRRADAVRSWLINAGVEPDRLTSVGYGETRPLAPNLTVRNRARNRRVQFMIQERDRAARPGR